MLVEKRNRRWSKERQNSNGAVKEKKQKNIRFQPLETLIDGMGSEENRPIMETIQTQTEARNLVFPIEANSGPSSTGQCHGLRMGTRNHDTSV